MAILYLIMSPIIYLVMVVLGGIIYIPLYLPFRYIIVTP